MSAVNITLVLTVILLANVVETMTGFAGTLLAMPFAMLLLGVDQARIVMNMVSIIVGAGILVQNHRYVNVRKLARILAFMLLGMVCGIWIYSYLSTKLLLKAYGVMIIGIAFKNLFLRNTGSDDKAASSVILILAGVIHGMFVSGGALLVVYAARVLKDKHEFRATMASVWVVLNTIIAAQQITTGLYAKENVQLVMLSVIPIGIANYVGNRIYGKTSQENFMKITYVLLFLSGASVLIG